jgi:uncharacterized protein (DUF2252 family)
MSASPFAFLRGGAAIMAADLSRTPASGLLVQACGDAHVSNFGLFATAERRLIFDLNDFDETLRAPFEWDVKRLAASVVTAGREARLTDASCAAAAGRAVQSYRTWMRRFAGMSHLDVWYAELEVSSVVQALDRRRRDEAKRVARRAQERTNPVTAKRLTTATPDGRRFRDDPPLVAHLADLAGVAQIEQAFAGYVSSLPEHLAQLLARYRVADVARKVVGIGSVGTQTGVVLMVGDNDADAIVLQVKEAVASVLQPYTPAPQVEHDGRRVVVGQRLCQAGGDALLGWTSVGDRAFYVRQLRDMKGSVDPTRLDAEGLLTYAGVCGGTLARAHARTGDAAAIAGYLGGGDAFDRAVGEFAAAYADQNERDFAAVTAAWSPQPTEPAR